MAWLPLFIGICVGAWVAAASSQDDTCQPSQPAVVEDTVSLVQLQRPLLNRRQSSLPPIVFLRTHKAGSSTMSNILVRLARRENLQPLLPKKGMLIDWQEMAAQTPPRHQSDILYCHQAFNETAVREYMKPGPFFFTIVREPLDMLRSRFRWLEVLSGSLEGRTWAERIKTMAENPGDWMNPLARDFGWYDGIDTRHVRLSLNDEIFSRDQDEAAITAFLQRINTTMDLVFPTLAFDEGLILLKGRLNLSLDDLVYLRQKDTSDVDDIPPPTEEEKEALGRFHKVDNRIFNMFLPRFFLERGVEQARSTDFADDLTELQRRIAEVSENCALEPRNETLCPEELSASASQLSYVYFPQ